MRRPTTPPPSTTARRRDRARGAERLHALAGALDAALGSLDDDHGALVHVAVPHDTPGDAPVDIGIMPTRGEHPFDLLCGFHAPDDWQVLGVVATGRAQRYDDPDADKVRASFVFLADRRGSTASLMRTADGTVALPGEPEGRIADAMRRALALPTEPPPCGTGVVFSALWLDSIVDAAGDPERRGSLSSWEGTARMHPAVSLAVRAPDPAALAIAAADLVSRWPWSRLRLEPDRWRLPGDVVLPRDVATWMDDGMFARWLLSELPSLGDLVHLAGPLVPDELAGDVVSVIAAALDAR
jgi:hypothetical protein